MARNYQGLQLVRCCWWNIRHVDSSCHSLLQPEGWNTAAVLGDLLTWAFPPHAAHPSSASQTGGIQPDVGKSVWEILPNCMVFSNSETGTEPPSKTLLSANPSSWRAGLWSKAGHSFSGGSLSGQMLSWLSPHLQNGVLPDSKPHMGAAPQRKSRRVYDYEHAVMGLHTNLADS